MYMDDKEEESVRKGFDRGIDYEPTKNLFIGEYNKYIDLVKNSKDSEVSKIRNKVPRYLNKLIYILISMIQLRNGSRISEAVLAFGKFMKNTELIDDKYKVLVKISKSECTKYKKDGEAYVTDARYRKIKFPFLWIKLDIVSDIKGQYLKIRERNIRKRVLDYLLLTFGFNTHSLRYAFINYMLYVQKRPINDVAKHVGHTNVSQLVTYTQQKNSDQIFDMDI